MGDDYKIPVSLRMDHDTIERIRNAVWWMGRGLTVTTVLEDAAAKAVKELEKHNGGKPFPQRKSPLPKAPRK